MDIWHLKLGFQSPIKHNLATHEGSENLVVKVTTDRGLGGYGEGIPRAFVTGETLTGSLAFLKETLGPAVLGRSWASPQEVLEVLGDRGAIFPASVVAFPAAWCALETALLDAAGRTWGQSVAQLIGPPVRRQLIYSAVLPMAGEARLVQFLQLVKQNRMAFLKLKVGNEVDLQVLRLARQELGEEIDIRVDANAAWTPGEAVRRIRAMAPFRISAVEQPVAKADFQGLKEVSDAVDLPIIADESLCTEEDARRLIALKACGIFNIRLSKCGGLLRAANIRRLAEAAGVRCQLGCHVGETSILSAAGRHFALCAENLAYVEGSFSPFLLKRDPVAQPLVFQEGGRAAALPGPGLGIEVREDLLAELALARYRLS